MPVTKSATHGRSNGAKAPREPARVAAVGRRGRPNAFVQKIGPSILKPIASFGDYISVVDAAEVFGVTTQTVRKWIGAGWLPLAFFPEGLTDRKMYMRTSEVISNINAKLRKAS